MTVIDAKGRRKSWSKVTLQCRGWQWVGMTAHVQEENHHYVHKDPLRMGNYGSYIVRSLEGGLLFHFQNSSQKWKIKTWQNCSPEMNSDSKCSGHCHIESSSIATWCE